MYIVLTFWALLALFWCLLENLKSLSSYAGLRFFKLGLQPNDSQAHLQRVWDALKALKLRIVEYQRGIRFAAAAAVPALLLSWLLCCALGYADLWDSFFPSWLVAGSAAVGDVVCDYLLDHLFWEVSR